MGVSAYSIWSFLYLLLQTHKTHFSSLTLTYFNYTSCWNLHSVRQNVNRISHLWNVCEILFLFFFSHLLPTSIFSRIISLVQMKHIPTHRFRYKNHFRLFLFGLVGLLNFLIMRGVFSITKNFYLPTKWKIPFWYKTNVSSTTENESTIFVELTLVKRQYNLMSETNPFGSRHKSGWSLHS